MYKNKNILRAALWNLVLMHRIMGKFLKQLLLHLEKQDGTAKKNGKESCQKVEEKVVDVWVVK